MFFETPLTCITLWEPWATLIAWKVKKIETRHWYTSYRGPIGIHAATRKLTQQDHDEYRRIAFDLKILGVTIKHPHYDFDFGCIIAVANLKRCERMEDLSKYSAVEKVCGNFEIGRYAWVLEDVRSLDVPIPAKGKQGLWKYTGEPV
ncbi:MAG: ASCH domain-containing protein [Candidatus Hydrogenedentales bacterium]|jgi:hypothetical protein